MVSVSHFLFRPHLSSGPPAVLPSAAPAPPANDKPPAGDDLRAPVEASPAPGLGGMPPEILVLISKQLIYPDALSLKHTSRYLYSLVDTGVRLKVAWLMERRMLHLECPSNTRCDLGSDLRFCRGSVALLMQRRREHIECESRPGLGCLVYGTSACAHRGKLSAFCKRWMRSQLTLELWWIVLAASGVLLSWLWMGELLTSRNWP
ncbi:hypothetical protein NKR23_g9162 [Pleurostoma richardsiae]|uniref:F-box domain-containing protein n=1 Tax=Pleurostoma richardsiae TaxID=41990 RepID=A0AA38RI22_9PEZI|nr:hypothetical protein NKR23_g9162 [Pleurostoma richardsiae]